MIDAETGWYFMHASVKGVVLADDAVLLCRNPRNAWELPVDRLPGDLEAGYAPLIEAAVRGRRG